MSGSVPAHLDPPLGEPVAGGDGIVSPVWGAWFQVMADRVAGGNVGGVRSGSFTADGAGNINLTFVPPFAHALAAAPTIYNAGAPVVPGTMGGGATGFIATGLTANHVYTFVAVGY